MNSLIYLILLYPIIYVFPAYCANGAPVVFGSGAPVDFKKKYNGKRIFGDHKTIKGLLAGVCSGIIIGFCESIVPGFSYMLVIGAVQGVGAMAGDLAGSFIKRQRGMKEGSKGGLMDQYLFVLFALALSIPFGHMPIWQGLAVVLVLTGMLHKLTNIIAHRLKMKNVPW